MSCSSRGMCPWDLNRFYWGPSLLSPSHSPVRVGFKRKYNLTFVLVLWLTLLKNSVLPRFYINHSFTQKFLFLKDSSFFSIFLRLGCFIILYHTTKSRNFFYFNHVLSLHLDTSPYPSGFSPGWRKVFYTVLLEIHVPPFYLIKLFP